MSESTRLADVADVRDLVDRIDDASDRKDWDACRPLFAEQLRIDFSALAGGEPATMSADELLASWRENLVEEKPTFHLRSHHRVTVDGENATCVSHGYALNVLRHDDGPDSTWEAWSWYTHTARRTEDGWVCTGMTIEPLHTRGDAAAVR